MSSLPNAIWIGTPNRLAKIYSSTNDIIDELIIDTSPDKSGKVLFHVDQVKNDLKELIECLIKRQSQNINIYLYDENKSA